MVPSAGDYSPAIEGHPQDVARHAGQVWLHSGDLGDIAYALATIQAGGGGDLLLVSIGDTREPMGLERFEFIAPLIQAQTYIRRFAFWEGEPVARDFTSIRLGLSYELNLALAHWLHVMPQGDLDLGVPWLTVPHAPRHGRPVFARSARYCNPEWDGFWQVLKKSAPDAIFIGTADEYQAFGHGEHVPTPDALTMARLIAGCSVFVGNQSFPYALAEGLKVGRLQEVSPLVPNCIFPGALALKGFAG
jgi:hypothetical protein